MEAIKFCEDGALLDFNYTFTAWYSRTIKFSPAHKLGWQLRSPLTTSHLQEKSSIQENNVKRIKI